MTFPYGEQQRRFPILKKEGKSFQQRQTKIKRVSYSFNMQFGCAAIVRLGYKNTLFIYRSVTLDAKLRESRKTPAIAHVRSGKVAQGK